MSTISFSFAVDRETERLFEEIMEEFGLDSKNQAFKWIIKRFKELMAKSKKYDTISEMILALETLDKYREGKLIPKGS